MNKHFAKRHYVAIAKVLTGLDMSGAEYDHVFQAFSDYLAEDNDKFDEDRFKNACYTREG